MSIKILITGGGGFIGKTLASKLLSLNHAVVILDKTPLSPGLDLEKAQFIQGDVCNPETWQQLPQCDYVFHLAAPSSIILFDKQLDECVKTTLLGLTHALAWAKKTGVKKLIYPSSGSIFGKLDTLCSETTIPNPVNSYGKTKLACEALAKIYEESVPNLGLRIFAGYGPQEDKKGEIASVVTLFIEKVLKNQSPVLFGDGRQTRDFIYIDDIVEIMVKTMTDKSTGVLNVGSGESISFNQVIEMINSLLHTNIQPTYVHKPKDYLEKTACDPTKFQKLLGRPITPFQVGLEKYLRQRGQI